MSRYLIKAGWVLSMDPKVGNHAGADVLIEDGLVTEVGPNLRARDAETIDAADCIVMPGFVDAHRHTWESLFRGLGDRGHARDAPSQLGPHHTSDDIYAATLLGLTGAQAAGITTVVDWADLPAEHVEAAAQAHQDSGLRTVLAPAGGTWADGDWRKARSAVPPQVDVVAAPPVSLRDLDKIESEWDFARREGLGIHAHAGMERAARGEVSAASRLLGEDVTLVHCSSLDPADFDAIASSGTSVVLAPSAEMAKGHEPPPIQQFIDREIRPGLGVDTERLAPGDIFAPMRAAISLQHATHFDLKLAGKGALPNLLTTREVIRYATIDGARTAGLSEVTGSLTPGKQADLIVLRADRPNIAPINDAIGAVVWGMDTSNLDWVFVAGEPRMREGSLVADVPGIRSRAMEAHRRVAGAAGILSGVEA